MTNLNAARAWLLAALFILVGNAWALQPIPRLQARVTDITGTLSATDQREIEQNLKKFEDRKGSQIAVLIVPTTEPEEIAQYSVRVFDQWKLGRGKTSDGALLLVAKDDRKLWITVGRGLEGALTDADSKRIVSEVIVPLFKAGEFAGGIKAGAERIMKIVDGEPLPAPQTQAYRHGDETDWTAMLPIAILLAFVSGSIFRAMFGRFFGSIVAGGATGFVTWILSTIFGLSVLAGILAFIFNLLAGAVNSPSAWSSRGRHSPGQWPGGGGFGGWGGGGFGGGGGGFSGGGGDTAGGGAGGEW